MATPRAKRATKNTATRKTTATSKDAPTKKATTAKPAQEAPSRVPGVRPGRTRPYLAGQIIAKHGLAAGVTDAMVAELDAAYGKANASESRFCLKNAHHSARGYLGFAEDAIA